MVTNTTTTYSDTASRGYGDPVGIRLITALEGTGADPFTVTQAVGQGTHLGLTPRHIITLLHRLSAAGWITRIKKGLYAVNDPVTRTPRAHPFAIGVALATPSAVSHWSALQHWGLTDFEDLIMPANRESPFLRGEGVLTADRCQRRFILDFKGVGSPRIDLPRSPWLGGGDGGEEARRGSVSRRARQGRARPSQ